MKVLYKPFGIVASIVGHQAGKRAFGAVWGRVSDAPKPKPTQPEAQLAKVMFAAALEAATLAAVGAASQTLASRAFHHLFGSWPGKAPDEPKHAASAAESATVNA